MMPLVGDQEKLPKEGDKAGKGVQRHQAAGPVGDAKLAGGVKDGDEPGELEAISKGGGHRSAAPL